MSRETSPTIVRVREVTIHEVDCNDPNQKGPFVPALVTFHGDGTMTADTGGLLTRMNIAPGSARRAVRITLSGIDRTALTRTAPFLNYGVITATTHLTDANSHTYSATIERFDADGNLFFTACGAAVERGLNNTLNTHQGAVGPPLSG